MTAMTRRIAILLSLTLSAVCYASAADRMTQQIVQEGPGGRLIRTATVAAGTGIESLYDLSQIGFGDSPEFAIGETLWETSDATGLMDNVAISDDGTIAAIGISLNNHRLQVIDATTGAINYEIPGVDGLSAVAVSPAGEYVAWAQSHNLSVLPGDQPTALWSLPIDNDHYFSSISLSHDGEQLAALETFGADSLYLHVYETATGDLLWERSFPMMAQYNQWIGARFTGDGEKIVATSRFRIFVVDAANGELIWDEDGRNTEHPATVSGDGRIIASASNNDGKIHVFAWDPNQSTYIQLWEYRFSGGTSNWGTATAVSYNGETIAGGSLQFTSTGYEGFVAAFETSGGGTPLWVSASMGDLVGDVEVSDDGLTLAACSWGFLNDSQPDIRVWQKYTPTPFFSYTHPGSPNDLDMSADGTRLIAGGKGVHNRVFGNGGRAYAFSLDLEGGSVAGSVTLQGTQDYSGVTVEAVGTHLHASTAVNGSYRIDHIPAGTYTITARKFGYTYGTATGVVITEDGLTSGVNFNLTQTEAAPQNLTATTAELRSVNLNWNPLGTTANVRRDLDARYAVGDLMENPLRDGSLLRWAAGTWPGESSPRAPRGSSLDDPDSIHVWRAALSGGPYALVGALDGAATSFGDSVGVLPLRTYYYVVTAVYSNGESAYSNEAVGSLDDSYLVWEPVVPMSTTPVTFNGVLSAGEWADAVSIDISDVFGYDGPNPPGSARLYMKYDDVNDMLYLACEDHLNPTLDDGEGFGIYVDDDDSDTWSYGRPGSEGNYWAYYFGSGATLRYRSLSGAPYNVDPYYSFTNPLLGFSTSAGYLTGEVAIPMGFHELYEMALYGPDKTPGIGFFVIQRQAGNPIFDGWWPQNIPSIVSNPEYFSNSSIQATLPVPPDRPTEVAVTRDGVDLHIAWNDPTVGVDGLPVSGMMGLIIYRNGEVLDFVQVGTESYTDDDVAFGAWYDYTISGYIIDDAIEFEGPQSIAEGSYAGGEPEIDYLVYDDDSWEYYMIVSGLYDENRFAVRCDMPPDRDFVYTVQIAVNGIAPIGIGVADDDGGVPGAQQFGPYFITPPVTEEFFTIHLPGEDIPAPSGVFWTTLDWTPDRPAEPGIATDGNGGNQGRSFWHQGATGWQNQPSNFMVRAGVGDMISDVGEPTPGVVHEYSLMANYPNPFNPETTIPFSLAKPGVASLTIYNVNGQLVATLVDGKQAEGFHVVRWNGRDAAGQQLASGIYFARLDAENFTQTRKLMLLK